MRRVLGREELEQQPDGARLPLPRGAIVTPLARDYAEEHGIVFVEGGADPADPPAPIAAASSAMPSQASEDDVVAAVTGEVVRSLLAEQAIPAVAPAGPGLTPRGERESATFAGHVAQCAACPNTRPATPEGGRGVVTATGRNQPGVLAAVSTEVARMGVDILDLSQTIVAGFFTMILVVDVRPLDRQGISFADFGDHLRAIAQQRGFEIQVLHERVLAATQRL